MGAACLALLYRAWEEEEALCRVSDNADILGRLERLGEAAERWAGVSFLLLAVWPAFCQNWQTGGRAEFPGLSVTV